MWVLCPWYIGGWGLVVGVCPICVSVTLLWLLLLLGISVTTGGWGLFLAMCGVMFW